MCVLVNFYPPCSLTYVALEEPYIKKGTSDFLNQLILSLAALLAERSES